MIQGRWNRARWLALSNRTCRRCGGTTVDRLPAGMIKPGKAFDLELSWRGAAHPPYGTSKSTSSFLAKGGAKSGLSLKPGCEISFK